MRSPTIAVLTLCLILPAAPATAMREGEAPPALAELGWRLVRTGDAPPAEFGLLPDGAVRVAADGAVGFLVRPVTAGDGQRLSWRWRVDAAPPATDLRAKGKDDRPVAVHVFFPFAEGERGLFGRIGDSLRSAADVPSGRVITYVWGGKEPPGTRFPSPYMRGNGAIVVLRGAEAPLGAWVAECVDPAADFRAAFGREPPAPNWIGLSADTDDRGGRAAAAVTVPAFVETRSPGGCP